MASNSASVKAAEPRCNSFSLGLSSASQSLIVIRRFLMRVKIQAQKNLAVLAKITPFYTSKAPGHLDLDVRLDGGPVASGIFGRLSLSANH